LVQRLNADSRSPFQLEYFSDGRREIDLIKSTNQINEQDVEKLSKLAEELGIDQKLIISQDEISRVSFGAHSRPWRVALTELFPKVR
jgi:hypothetical protein